MKYTFHVLKYFHLTWTDSQTQCILSEILFGPNHQSFDRYHLQLMYKYCFYERQYRIIRRKFNRDRRGLELINRNNRKIPLN